MLVLVDLILSMFIMFPSWSQWLCAQERAHFFKQNSKSENKVLPMSFQIMFESGFVLLFFAWAFQYTFCELFAWF